MWVYYKREEIFLSLLDMKVTIITVCRNAQDTIEATVKSVLSQDYKNIEYIIIDGKSTDKTLGITHKYKNKITTLISESDTGIYDAMNKGLKYTTGEVVNFLNAGDVFIDKSVVSDIVKQLKKKGTDMIYGDALIYNPKHPEKLTLKCHKYADIVFLSRWCICHQAIFAKKYLFDQYGFFDTQYKLVADHEWILRMLLKHKVSTRYVNRIIVRYLAGGESSNNAIRLYQERFSSLSHYLSIYKIVTNIIKLTLRGRNRYFHPYVPS